MNVDDVSTTVPLVATQNSYVRSSRGPVDSPDPRQQHHANTTLHISSANVVTIDVDGEDDEDNYNNRKGGNSSMLPTVCPLCHASTVNCCTRTGRNARPTLDVSVPSDSDGGVRESMHTVRGSSGGDGWSEAISNMKQQISLKSEPLPAVSAQCTTVPPLFATEPSKPVEASQLESSANDTSPSASMPSPSEANGRFNPTDSLSDEQLHAYDQVVHKGRSVFITGGAGTGKSHLLRTIIGALPASTTFVTATTGIAALNLGGTTLHSFAGCGLLERGITPDRLLGRVLGNKKRLPTWRACRVLVIDEVSMLDGWFFDMLDFVARRVRKALYEPFGGIQLILSGDFLQLPPVMKDDRAGIKRSRCDDAMVGDSAGLCFESNTWLRVNPRICLLTRPYRQKEAVFFNVLNELRFGVPSPESIATLTMYTTSSSINFVKREGGAGAGQQLQQVVLTNEKGVTHVEDFDGYTILRPFRAEVDNENERYFSRLRTEIIMYQGFHTGEGSYPEKNLPALVRLREGCRVMLTKNFDTQIGLANGSTGTVTGFIDFSKGYSFKNGATVGSDARRVCKGRGGLMERPHTLLPVVSFDIRKANGGVTTREVVVEPQEWKEMRGDHAVSRSVQIPLILAYAITIHKSQGMSLTHVDIDFRNIFEAGQAYVALSRATDLRNVRLHSFDAHVVSPNACALAYYKAIALAEQRAHWRREHALECQTDPEGGTTAYVVTDTARGTHTPCGHQDDGLAGDYAATPYGYVLPREYARDCRAYLDAKAEAANGVEYDDTGLGLCVIPNESTHLNAVRLRVSPLMELSTEVYKRVTHLVVPAERVFDARLVMDTSAFFDLITGANSAAQFDLVFGNNANMMRVPLVVRELICAAAAFNEENPTATTARARDSADASPRGESGGTNADSSSTCSAATAAKLEAMSDLSQASAVAAEVLALFARAKADFILDDQRPGERLPLPAAAAGWLQFAEVLPLLQPGAPSSIAADDACSTSVPLSSDAACTPLVASEFDFLLNRDPRETEQHRDILEYAVYLRETHGNNTMICTDSPILAAYTMAFGFRVASMGFLRSSK